MGRYFIGVMSGTSVDAIDAVVVDFDGTANIHLLASTSRQWPDALRQELLALGAGSHNELDRAGEADGLVAEQFAAAIADVLHRSGLQASDIRAIGSHGQTVRHRPNADKPFTLQLGDPNTLAELTGIAVVADFRRRDMAAGGQGAPLVPAFHQALFAHSARTVAVLNLGGIANITVLRPGQDTLGYDTGPANMLMDGWCQRHTGQAFDQDGQWAASATADDSLLEHLLKHPYLQRAHPKSTGREEFGLRWLDDVLTHHSHLAPAVVQATLLAFTTRSVVAALLRHAGTGELLVCGGGARNAQLMHALSAALPAWDIRDTGSKGLDPAWVEAAAFAWLARQTVLGLAGNLPAVTGARGPRVLGAYHPAREGRQLP